MSEKKPEELKGSENEDKELADLLDSALEDFSKSTTKETKIEPKAGTTNSNEKPSEPESQPENGNVDQWFEEFAAQAAKQFEQNFGSLLTNPSGEGAQLPPELTQQKLLQMAEAAQQVLANPEVTDTSTDFAKSISQAVQGLNQGAEGLQNPFGDEDLMRMFEGGAGGENAMIPFMQGMMQGLLTKEVLGPSLQDFVDKFPAYIEENKQKLDKAEVDRYEKQKKLMEEVLEELNKENDSDSADVKKERFTKVLALMQKLQDLGQPPQELMGDSEAPPFSFDPQGNPVGGLDGVNSECCLM